MTIRLEDYDKALTRAAERARQWLGSIDDRRVAPARGADAVLARVGGVLPRQGCRPDEVVDLLADEAEAGLMAITSGRFFGWVMGGILPAGLAADWLVSAWDQNAGMRYATPAAAAFEEAAAQWLLDLLGLPATADVGFVTGGTMAHFTGLAAARTRVLQGVGWDVNEHGLGAAPKVHLLVGAERHDTVDLALRYLGLGRPRAVAVDEQGRIRVDALERPWTRCRTASRSSSVSRRATSTPEPSIPSDRPSRLLTLTAPGCTSTVPSASGPRRLRTDGG